MTTVILLVVAAVFGCAAGLVVFFMVQRREEEEENDEEPRALPPLFFPLPSPEHARMTGNGAAHPNDTQVQLALVVEPPRLNARVPSVPHDDRPEETETVRFVRPSDLSVQLLPGRLEVLAGATHHREIRFIRVPGEPAQVILGRDAGPSPQYIGLGSPTVSRRHARFDYDDSCWKVKNLSRTNPLVVNDDELFDTDAARVLADGDRLELGEVVLLFHAH